MEAAKPAPTIPPYNHVDDMTKSDTPTTSTAVSAPPTETEFVIQIQKDLGDKLKIDCLPKSYIDFYMLNAAVYDGSLEQGITKAHTDNTFPLSWQQLEHNTYKNSESLDDIVAAQVKKSIESVDAPQLDDQTVMNCLVWLSEIHSHRCQELMEKN